MKESTIERDKGRNPLRFVTSYKHMLRWLTSSSMALVMFGLLVCGQCGFASPVCSSPKKNCCKQPGECKQSKSRAPLKDECRAQHPGVASSLPSPIAGLHHLHDYQTVDVAIADDMCPAQIPAQVLLVRSSALVMEHSPPDKQALNAVFLI